MFNPAKTRFFDLGPYFKKYPKIIHPKLYMYTNFEVSYSSGMDGAGQNIGIFTVFETLNHL